MEKPTACLMCGSQLEQPPSGRPKRYCDSACRRAGEYEMRRAQSLLLTAERNEQRARARAATAKFSYGDASGERSEVRWWSKEATRLQHRLRELLAAGGADD